VAEGVGVAALRQYLGDGPPSARARMIMATTTTMATIPEYCINVSMTPSRACLRARMGREV
jgi:hypothetical protein